MPLRSTFELPSGTIAALDNGLVDSAETVLLVPGYTGSKEDFQPLLRPLAEAGLRAIAIDQRGQYQSSWARTEHGYRLAELAEDLIGVAGRLRADARALHLVGHSFGGLVARQAAVIRGELFDDLVLMSSGPAAIGGSRRTTLEAGERVLAESGMRGLWQLLEDRARADPRYVRTAPSLRAFLRERFLATDPIGLRVMGTTLREEPDRTAQLAATGLDIMVLYGENDDAWPPAVQAEMAGRLGALEAVIENAAHSPAVENPLATVRAMLKFWSAG
ncbi:MAG TPA: alpha/beta fold hydrolase [Jatrophihabitans sp.]|nr:alpha/beta fold hydrolase [Jatrophihabitans sp.]